MKTANLKLSALWIVHFLLWSYGDIFAIMQEKTEPVTDTLLTFVAAPLGIVQGLLILSPLFFKRKAVRIIHFIGTPLFLFFNIVNYFDVSAGWGYVLTTSYVCLNILVFWTAMKWEES